VENKETALSWTSDGYKREMHVLFAICRYSKLQQNS